MPAKLGKDLALTRGEFVRVLGQFVLDFVHEDSFTQSSRRSQSTGRNYLRTLRALREDS
jgi:hypothetical protein